MERFVVEVQLKVKVESTLKEAATQKAKAENKTMKQLIEELLLSYVRGTKEEDPITPHSGQLKPEDFATRLEYVDYLEKNGLIY